MSRSRRFDQMSLPKSLCAALNERGIMTADGDGGRRLSAEQLRDLCAGREQSDALWLRNLVTVAGIEP